MQLRDACVAVLQQMETVVGQVKDDDFVKQSASLSHVTIGQHLRHTIEFFLCLESGFTSGTVNYDKRSHDKMIESDRELALLALARIKAFVAGLNEDRSLRLEVGYERNSSEVAVVATTYYRELIYNIEHAVHHMALMKVGIREVAPYVSLPMGFGVAVSTLRHADLTQSSS